LQNFSIGTVAPRTWILKSIKSSVHQLTMLWSTHYHDYIADAKVAHVLSGVPAGDGAALLKKLRSAEGSDRRVLANNPLQRATPKGEDRPVCPVAYLFF
jgi:hypothetical protein